MRRMAGEYPLRIKFSERKDGEFLAEVPVVNMDGHGKQVFELSKAGPMLYVKLPNGKYKVSARFKGLTESQEVMLAGKDGKDLQYTDAATRSTTVPAPERIASHLLQIRAARRDVQGIHPFRGCSRWIAVVLHAAALALRAALTTPDVHGARRGSAAGP